MTNGVAKLYDRLTAKERTAAFLSAAIRGDELDWSCWQQCRFAAAQIHGVTKLYDSATLRNSVVFVYFVSAAGGSSPKLPNSVNRA